MDQGDRGEVSTARQWTRSAWLRLRAHRRDTPDPGRAGLRRAGRLDVSAAERVFGYRQATIITWLTRAGEHAQFFHERSFRHLWLPHLQLDELRTRLRSSQQVLWLWVAIDPCTKILPVLQLGPRTQHTAHLLIHCLQQLLAPGCLPLFTSDGLNVYFYAHYNRTFEKKSKHPHSRSVERLSY